MLQTIREKIQGWIAGIISTILIFSFAFWGIHSYFSTGSATNFVAEVNGVEISKDQFSIAYERLRRQAQSRFVNLAEQEGKIKEQALQSLINIEILKQASLSRNYFISNNQIDNYLQSMSEFQVDGQFSLDRFNELLSNSLLSAQDFFDLIKTNLLIDQPKLGIIFTSFSLPNEVDEAIALIDQTRSILSSVISLDSFPHQEVNISEKQIADYYRNHPYDFKTPEKVSVNYLELALNDIKKTIVPTTEELQKFYNENLNSYAEPMEWKLSAYQILYSAQNRTEREDKRRRAETLLEDLRAGKSPSKAVEFNLLPFSNRFISAAELPSELQKTVSSLSKSNEFSPVIDTGSAFIVVQVNDVKTPRIKPFEEVKEKVATAYIKQKSEELFSEFREKLADLTYQNPNSLEVAAKELNLTVKSSPLFSLDKPHSESDISSHKKVRDLAFSSEILKMGNNSDVFSLDANSAMVIRSNSHVLSSIIPLNSVSFQIIEKLKKTEIEKQFKKYIDHILLQLNSGKNAEAVSQEFNFAWKKTEHIGRYAYSSISNPLILDAAFSLPILNQKNKMSKFVLIKLSENKYAILSLLEVKQGEAKDEKQTSIFTEQVQNSLGLLEYELYKQSLLKNAKVNIFSSFESNPK